MGDAINRASELRAKAEKCIRIARLMPPGPDAEMINGFGLEYLELADKLEAQSEPEADRTPDTSEPSQNEGTKP
jgi:hypothetical protein